MADPINSPKTSSPKEDDGPARRVGSIIKGKWNIESLLGVGGMASVYAATHRNGQRAALKVLHLDFARDKTICERFLREGYVSNKIGHPACVAVLDDDRTDDDAPFLVMELLEGETVRDIWKRSGRRMPVPMVLKICDDVLDCLVACHAIGVIHRDLKPANIFVTREGITKVLDFGVAQMRSATAERTATGTALGTPAYMSPEQAMGLVDQLDGRADIFSIGAMIHALTTGHRINSGRTENEALVMAATTPVPSVARIAPDLPVPLIALIDKSLAWDRRNRYENAREMQAAIREVLAVLAGGVAAAAAPPAVAREIEIPPIEGEVSPRATARSAPAVQPVHVSRQPTGPSAIQSASMRAPAPGQPTSAPASMAPAAAAVVPIAQPAAAPVDESRLESLRDLFKRVDRLLPNVRQLGWAHPATDRAMRQTYDGFAEAIAKDPGVVDFSIRPYSMLMGGQTVWEPGAPFDAIPYNLFACGMRTMRMLPGITLEELKETLALWLLDPGRDLPPEDDLAAAFWERAMPHVRYEVVDAFVEGDAAEREAFYTEADDLERVAAEQARQASALEAKAMAVSTDRAALRSAKAASPMVLEEVVSTVLARQLELPRDKWSERYVDAVTEGYIDAAVNRDAPLVLAALRKSSADLVVAGRFDVIITLHAAMIERLGQRLSGQNLSRLASALTNAMFGAETLELSLKHLATALDRVPYFQPILMSLNPSELPTVLAAFRAAPPPPLRNVLLAYIQQSLPGNEAEVAAAAVGLDSDGAYLLLSLISRAGTPEGRQALAMMAQHEDVNVRTEARVLALGSADAASAELTALCDNDSALVRMAAVRAIARHDMKVAWTAIARHIKSNDFNDRGSDERREFIRALVILAPDRGEPMALEIAKKGGVFVSESREGTRVVAADVLGELSRTASVASGLRELSLSRWGTSDETRAAAARAADQISARIAGEAPGQGPYGSASPAGAAP